MARKFPRAFLLCLLLSLVLHFTIGPLLVHLFARRMTPAKIQEVVYATSSALRITHRTNPHPATHTIERPVQAIPHPAHRRVVRAAPRHEIAHFNPRARHAQSSPAPQVAIVSPQQEVTFEKTIAQLREAQNPLLGATRSTAPPQTVKRYRYNISGAIGAGPQSQGILSPVTAWHQDGYDYYYVRYWAQYADGTTETGIVPWPIRYRPAVDPFRLGLEHFPLPVPLPGYRLPAGTNLHPLVAYCYEHRRKLPSCPIYNG